MGILTKKEQPLCVPHSCFQRVKDRCFVHLHNKSANSIVVHMASLSRLLDITQSGDSADVQLVAGHGDTNVNEVRLIEQIDELDEARPGALVVLDRDLSLIADSYKFDIAVRRAASHGVAGVAVFHPRPSDISTTAIALARKAGVAIIGLAITTDVSDVVQTMARRATDDLHVTVDQARSAMAAIDTVDRRERTVDDLVRRTSALLGHDVIVGHTPSEGAGRRVVVPAVVTEPDGDQLSVDSTGTDDADALIEMVLWRLAAEISRLSAEDGNSERARRQSSAEVLLRLLEADRATRADLAPLARRVGINAAGWHAVARFEFDNLTALFDDEVSAYNARDRLASLALDSLYGRSASCHVAHEPGVLAVLWSEEHPPTPEDGLVLQRAMVDVAAALSNEVVGLRFFAGIGTARAELAGLSTSATEARLAVSAARSRRRLNQPTSFDALGLRPTLVEWYGSPTVRESTDALLAPLGALSVTKRKSLLDTLCAYLDAQGSVTTTATQMHLHRNAVRYRIRQVTELLDVDIDDPDQRLFLHLALRAKQGR